MRRLPTFVRARANNLAARIPILPGLLARAQARIYLATNGRRWNRKWGMPLLVLETVGRRTGLHRATPLIYLEGHDRVVVLPARAGSRQPPAWALNLQSNPEAVAIIDGHRRKVRARVLEGDEHEAAWQEYARRLPDIEEFQRLARRRLPLLALDSAGGESPEEAIEKRRHSTRGQLGPPRKITLPQGTVSYRDVGAGPTLVFMHGLWVNGDVWRNVADALQPNYRCVVPDLPLGSHTYPLGHGVDLTPSGVAQLMVDFMNALDLRDVTLVSHDTSNAFAQVLVTEHPARVARLVMAPGDAFWNFLPPAIRPMGWIMRSPAAALAVSHFWHTKMGRALIMLPLAKHRVPPAILESNFAPATLSEGVRDNLVEVMRHAKPSVTRRAARTLHRFSGPTLIVWNQSHTIIFPRRHAYQLAARLPHAQVQLVDDAFAFIPEDQPEAFAAMIDRFVADTGPRPNALEHRTGAP